MWRVDSQLDKERGERDRMPVSFQNREDGKREGGRERKEGGRFAFGKEVKEGTHNTTPEKSIPQPTKSKPKNSSCIGTRASCPCRVTLGFAHKTRRKETSREKTKEGKTKKDKHKRSKTQFKLKTWTHTLR